MLTIECLEPQRGVDARHGAERNHRNQQRSTDRVRAAVGSPRRRTARGTPAVIADLVPGAAAHAGIVRFPAADVNGSSGGTREPAIPARVGLCSLRRRSPLQALVSRTLLVAASLFAGWLAVEGIARVALGPPLHASDRAALFSSPFWVEAKGAVRYAPRAELRTAAVYGERIEYDVRFRTNDLGFIDDRNYAERTAAPQASERFAFVGDSFTAGFHAGPAWPGRLRAQARDRGRNVEIYNLGVSGASLRQFPALLRSLRGEIEFEQLVFLFIGDDLLREAWRPVEANGRLYVCPLGSSEARCVVRDTPLLVLADKDASREELLAQVRASGIGAAPTTLGGWLERNTFAGSRFSAWRDAQARAARPSLRIDLEAWLAGLARNYGDRSVTFMHIPERAETSLGRYASEAGPQIEAAGFRYVPLLESCDFEEDDYFEVDPHFRASGYEKLIRCTGEALGLL